MKLHLGCGRTIIPGWINLDWMAAPGVDLVVNLDDCEPGRIPLANDSVDELLAAHLIEHIRSPLPLMQELHRITRPNGLMKLRVPYGSSDDAWTDPTHCRPYFIDSWGYFGQPYYWRADYGYRGDWDIEELSLILPDSPLRDAELPVIADAVACKRNQVLEMVVVLRAVKPIRPASAELIKPLFVNYLFQG